MAKRAKKRSTSRSASAHTKERRAPADDGGRARDESPNTGARILAAVTQALQQAALFGRHHPLGRLYVESMVQTLEWQSMLLEIYQRLLREGALDTPSEEQLRKMARSMMGVYLDLAKSAPERGKRLLDGQAALARGLAETIEDMRQWLAMPKP